MHTDLLQDFIHATRLIPMNGVVVFQHGEKIAQHEWEPEIRQNQYSVSKSFTSAAVGFAVSEGLLNLDQRVAPFFKEQCPANPSPWLLSLKLFHLLCMSLGQEQAHLMGASRPAMTEKDWVSYCLRQPFSTKPGTEFLYNNAGPYLAGMMVQKSAGCDLITYLMPRLFEPLGIYRPVWECDPYGNTFGSGGLFLTVTELAKFGQLYLAGGKWDGKQLLPEDWIRQSTKPQMLTGSKRQDKSQYGYGFWLSRNGSFRADGKYGQYCIVLPDKDAVVAINAYNRGEGDILGAFWDTLYPKL